jgi:rod shape determining protein RodA
MISIAKNFQTRGFFLRLFKNIDWLLFSSAFLIAVGGLVTMNSFVGENYFFEKQTIWLSVSVAVFFILSLFDFRFLRRTGVIVSLFLVSCFLLISLFVIGSVFQGAQRWLDLGFFSFQVSDPIKLVVILILAKYFTRRHIEISQIRHILVSGFYVFVIALLVFLQPDFGSAIIISSIWLGMVLVSGISKKHLLAVFLAGAVSFLLLWTFALGDFQKQRIMTFLQPTADPQGAGYHAIQSTIAVGSGQMLGKGIGYGTQSKLRFLPEYQTDFIFAAFAEEWGFIGVILLFGLFAVVIGRILWNGLHGATNFEILFGAGLAIYLMAHFIVHVGMNVGLLPVTGTTLPFMSYGGSHLLTEFAGLGILMGMRRYNRTFHKEKVDEKILT